MNRSINVSWRIFPGGLASRCSSGGRAPTADSAAARKRIEIRDALRKLGHYAAFSEEFEAPNGNLSEKTKEYAQAMCADLIIVVQDSPGSLAEVHDFCNDPHLFYKMQIMIPSAYRAGYSVKGAIKDLLDATGGGGVYFYTEEDLKSCEVRSRAVKPRGSSPAAACPVHSVENGVMKFSPAEVASAELLFTPEALFVLWLVRSGLCREPHDFLRHFGEDFAGNRWMIHLEQEGFLEKTGNTLSLTSKGDHSLDLFDESQSIQRAFPLGRRDRPLDPEEGGDRIILTFCPPPSQGTLRRLATDPAMDLDLLGMVAGGSAFDPSMPSNLYATRLRRSGPDHGRLSWKFTTLADGPYDAVELAPGGAYSSSEASFDGIRSNVRSRSIPAPCPRGKTGMLSDWRLWSMIARAEPETLTGCLPSASTTHR